ncbi:SCO family protein [Halobacillus sp. A5]|uniref:SCO family protein n=1 Tax=Halobacillus sp. A5 TaxID=2880263 RepID=UPI0020A64F53|nr:SCO family protein [Halobacillus sp. A5]MCP3026293.1 SCO family protein [Halobacillus sp. A5]
MKHLLWMILVIIMLTSCGSPIDETMSRDVESFEGTNQHGEEISFPKQYEGEYWVANLIFTRCDTVCPPMTSNMSRLQQQLSESNIDAPLVSFSVDPEYDTEKKLEEFAAQYNADLDTWDFMTGYSFQDIKELSIKSFQSPLKQLDNSDQMTHGTNFFLINPDGKVIKSYDGTKADNMNDILEDLKKVQ